jgi:hypothetical protein
MAKNKVSEWSATPANNTDIANIDIAEGCAPSGINNAIRELMAQVKDMQTGADGDNFTVGNNLSVLNDSVFTGTVLIGETLTSAGVITGTAGFSGNLTGNVTGNVSGTSGNVSGVVAVANGGTGLATLTANNVMLGNGTSSPSFVAPSTANNVLKSNGTTWVSGAGLTTTTGDAPYYGARAWVNFDGTTSPPTIKASGNVSSVTKNSTGDYTINFTVALPDANYCVSTNQTTNSAGNSGQGLYVIGDIATGATLKTTTQLRVGTFPNILTQLDYADCYVVVFR